MKKVLVITYYWPPSGGGSVQRWFHFVRNLKKLGVEPVVLTVAEDKASYPLTDKSLSAFVDDIETIKTDTFELLKIYSQIKSGDQQTAIPYGGLAKKKSFFTWVSAWVRGNIFIPDARMGWKKYAVKAATERLKQGDISHIITTGPPHSAHLIGLELKKRFPKIEWLADFRDPWTELYINETLPQTNWAKKKNARYEISVLENADKVITVGNEMAKLLAKKIEDKQKVSVIYNGFDETLFADHTPQQTEKFTLLHVGLLGEKQDVTPLAKGVKKLAENYPKEKISFQIIGKIAETQQQIWNEICPEISIENLGYLAQKDAVAAMFRANVLVNITPETSQEKIMVSTKTMEYLRTGIPVLVISNENTEFDFLFQGNEFLQTFKRNDADSITQFLQKLYTLWEQKEVPATKIDVTQYSRQVSAKRLIEILG